MFTFANLKNARRVLLLVIICVALSPFKTVRSDMNRHEKAVNDAKPTWSVECMLYVREEICNRFAATPTDPIEYFKTLDLVHDWQAAFQKGYSSGLLFASNEEVQGRLQLGGMNAGMQGIINDAQSRYHAKFTAQAMAEVSKIHYNQKAWDKIPNEWSPNLGFQFLQSWLLIGLLSFISTFLLFLDYGNMTAFIARLPVIVPMCFIAGPLTARWAEPSKGMLASDLWLVTSLAGVAVSMASPAGTMLVKAQPSSSSKGKASVSRTSSGSESASETSGDVITVLKRLGINSLAVEALPATADGTLRELSIEYTATTPLGPLGKVSWFGFGELRPGSQFTNHSASFMPTFVGVMSEQGWNGKKLFWDAGGKVNLTATPKVGKPLGKAFNFLSVAYTHGIVTAPKHQIIVAWATKDWSAWSGKLKFRSEGFYRIRPGDVTNYGQPQILVQFGNCTKVKALVQFDTPGRSVGVSAGAKFYFSLR